MNADKMLDFLKDSALRVAQTFSDPKDDWAPVVFFDDGESVIPTLLAIPKEQWPAAIEAFGPCRCIGFIASGWALTVGKDWEQGIQIPPSLDPERYELLTVSARDDKGVKMSAARILRNGLPTLGLFDERHDVSHHSVLDAAIIGVPR